MRFLIEKQGSEVPSQAYVLQTGSGELSVVQVGNQDPTKVCEGCFRWHFYVCVFYQTNRALRDSGAVSMNPFVSGGAKVPGEPSLVQVW